MNVLFVSNGHGEASIADRIALELYAIAPSATVDHLALVGDTTSDRMNDVGPRRAMPSGGLIAMGNVANIARDVRSGLLGLTLAQYRFLRAARNRYDAVVAIGDVYALAMALAAGSPTVFVGTAKSVYVAPYGPFEERILRRASATFVRDEPTARRLRERGVGVDAAVNAIVDLFEAPDDPRADRAFEGFDPPLALFPGSRESAYSDARFLCAVVRDLPFGTGAVLSVARNLDQARFAREARADGFVVTTCDDEAIPFECSYEGRVVVRAWTGAIGPLLRRCRTVLGQAGTANEAAAAAGVPVVAFERAGDRKGRWYRRRQRGLLGDALAVLPSDEAAARSAVAELLADPLRRERMGETGKQRMGPPGGARVVAQRVAAMAGRG